MVLVVIALAAGIVMARLPHASSLRLQREGGRLADRLSEARGITAVSTGMGGDTNLGSTSRAAMAKDFARAFAVWERLGPLARYAWRNPIRDYRPRMKEVLKMQGLIAHATVRPPQLGIDDDERIELRRLATLAGLIGSTTPATGIAA